MKRFVLFFAVLCFLSTMYAISLHEDFEGRPFPPYGWTVHNFGSSNTWVRGDNAPAHGGRWQAMIESGYNQAHDDWLITPQLMPVAHNYVFMFWARNLISAYPCKFDVKLSTGTTAVEDFTVTLAAEEMPYSTYTLYVYNLTAYINTPVYLALHTRSQTYGTLYVDDVDGPEMILPPQPSGSPVPYHGARYIDPSHVDISWALAWGATGYMFYLGTLSSPNYYMNLVNETSFHINNLQPNTRYYWQVKPYNNHGEAADCPVWYFDTSPEDLIVIGDGSQVQRQPFASSWGYERSAALYPASELGGSGFLQRVGWYCTGSSGANLPYKIYMGSTAENQLTNTDWDSFTSSMVLVKEGTYSFQAAGWHAFDLDFAYPCLGENLIVAVEVNYGGYGDGPDLGFRYTETAANSHLEWHERYTPPLGSGNPDNKRPNLILVFHEPHTEAVFEISPNPWHFPSCLIHTEARREFTILNSGESSLQIQSITVAGDCFQIEGSPAPISLAYGEMSNFTVKFLPTAGGSHSGTVFVSTNVGNYSVALTGDCQDPTIYTFPYEESFDEYYDMEFPFGWSVLSLGNPQNTWEIEPFYANSEPFSVGIGENPAGTGALNDWLISPPLHLAADTSYDLEFYYCSKSGSHMENLALYWGTEPTADGMGVPVTAWHYFNNDYYVPALYNLIVPETGDYYLGWHAYSPESRAGICIDDIKISLTAGTTALTVTPNAMDFGSVQHNLPSGSQNLTIRNQGSTNVLINTNHFSFLGANAADFRIDWGVLPAFLQPNQSVNVRVYVFPGSTGAISATLRFRYQNQNYDVALAATVGQENTSIIGNGNQSSRHPFGIRYGYERSAALYSAQEIRRSGVLDELGWNVFTAGSNPIPYKIYVGGTTAATLEPQSWAELTENLTLVSFGTELFDSTGWHTFAIEGVLIEPDENLIVAVESDFGGAGTGTGFTHFYYTPAIDGLHQFYGRDFEPPSGVGTFNEFRPNLLLHIVEPLLAPPAAPQLLSPAHNATEMPLDGFKLKWRIDLCAGGVPDHYQIYLATDLDNLEDDYYFETQSCFFDPVNDGDMVFEYGESWYWTVKAVNAFGETFAEDVFTFLTESDPAVNLPHTEDFGDDGSFPLHWTQSYSGDLEYELWSMYNTSFAGGEAWEICNESQYACGISRLISPPINTQGLSTLNVAFKHFLSGYDEGCTGKVQYSHNLNDWLDSGFSFSTAYYIGPETVVLEISNLNADVTYIAWVMDGDHFMYNEWYVDDVQFFEPLAIDLAAVEISGPGIGFEGTQLMHKAKVRNAGTQAVNGFTVHLKDEDGFLLGSQNCTEPLGAGESIDIGINWTPAWYGEMTLFAEVECAGDLMLTNNLSSGFELLIFKADSYYQDFEANQMPRDWTVLNLSGAYHSWNISTEYPHSGERSAFIQRKILDYPNDDWLISPPLQFTYENDDIVCFWMRTASEYLADPWEVLISTTDQEPDSFTVIDSGPGYLEDYEMMVYFLSDYLDDDAVVYFAIRYLGNQDWCLCVDDFIGPPLYMPDAPDSPQPYLVVEEDMFILRWEPVENAEWYGIYMYFEPYDDSVFSMYISYSFTELPLFPANQAPDYYFFSMTAGRGLAPGFVFDDKERFFIDYFKPKKLNSAK